MRFPHSRALVQTGHRLQICPDLPGGLRSNEQDSGGICSWFGHTAFEGGRASTVFAPGTCYHPCHPSGVTVPAKSAPLVTPPGVTLRPRSDRLLRLSHRQFTHPAVAVIGLSVVRSRLGSHSVGGREHRTGVRTSRGPASPRRHPRVARPGDRRTRLARGQLAAVWWWSRWS